MKKHRCISIFQNPKLNDRELMCLLLYEVSRARADVKLLSKILQTKFSLTDATFATLLVEADREAQSELAEDIRQFEQNQFKPPK